MLGRARPIVDESGAITRWIGTCTDIDRAKRIAEQNDLLSRELSHRIKNIFAVISGLISLSVRQFPECKGFAFSLRERIAALGRAHEFVRPHSEESKPVIGRTTLKGLLQDLFRPYPASEEGRFLIVGDDLAIDDRGATPISLVFHELATNASKYGALSVADGQVEIDVKCREGKVHLSWREIGGPLVSTSPSSAGFGSKLARLSIVDQLGGTIQWDWDSTGLTVKIELDPERLVRD